MQLISLQKGEGTKQLNEIDFEVVNFGSEFDNGESRFVDTAAVIENCDLIITSDTSVAHLVSGLVNETDLGQTTCPYQFYQCYLANKCRF